MESNLFHQSPLQFNVESVSGFIVMATNVFRLILSLIMICTTTSPGPDKSSEI